ncbi:hypothetical protein GCM10020001_013510 [Nonomuraea salmonea]
MLYLPIGTGIAGAVVPSGALYGGAGGWAGQIGHVPVWPDGLACGCGQAGCLAAYASGSAVAARCGVPGAEDVVRLAAQGDARATAVWAEAVEALALALATYTLVLDPAAVVIGGAACRRRGTRSWYPCASGWPPGSPSAPLPTYGPRASAPPLAGLLGAALLGWTAQG